MKKILFAMLSLSLLTLLAAPLSMAADDSNAQVVVKAVDVGNKICPVSGENILEEQKATYEYQGKIYNFCCSKCIDTFKKDPEKYIKKVEEELKAEKEKTEVAVPKAQEDPHAGHQHH